MVKLYTINEVCDALKVSRRTIERWRKENKIEVININGSLRVKENELLRLMKGVNN